ncbi:MAG: hypothetical protein ACPKQO_06670, partial [Nitrososphaeraceae archaeon]
NLNVPEPVVCPDSGFLVNNEDNCPTKCPDGTYIMQGMECPPIPGQLNVTKVFNGCTNGIESIDCPEEVPSSASDFTIDVIGINANPPTFLGDETGTLVTMESGAYEVTEEVTNSQIPITSPEPKTCFLFDEINAGAILDADKDMFICTTFGDNCDGNIEAEQELTCIIENTVLLEGEGQSPNPQ